MTTKGTCQCTMAQSMVGDGCRYCQPQAYIDRLHDLMEEDERRADTAEEIARRVVSLVHPHASEDTERYREEVELVQLATTYLTL